MKIQTSRLIPFVLLALIPISWVIDIIFTTHSLNMITTLSLNDKQIDAIVKLSDRLPIKELVTAITVIIPAIFARKMVAEGTNNMKKGRETTKEP